MNDNQILSFCWKAACFVPLFVLVALVNWFVDPNYLFSRRQFQVEWATRIARANCRGHNVLLPSMGDERLLQRIWIGHLERSPDILVLGSSRTMYHDRLSKNETLCNSSVSGASLEDAIAIFQLYAERGFTPKKLVLGLDPWVLNRNNDLDRWQSLAGEYCRALAGMHCTPTRSKALTRSLELERLAELFSPSYFQASLKSVVARRDGRAEGPEANPDDLPVATDQCRAAVTMRFPDGSLEHPERVLLRDVALIRAAAASYGGAGQVYGLRDFKELDADLANQFESFMRRLHSAGIQVVLYLPPYHPIAHERILGDPRYRIVRDVERYFRKYGQLHGLVVCGSYDPHQCGVSEADFVDATHLRRNVMPRLLGTSPVWAVAGKGRSLER